MISAYYTIVGAVLVLGVMILIHELGHFMAAKLLGVRVEVFSIGFGKRLLGFHIGDTDYRLSALPLGGYVKMTGVNAVEMPEEGAPAAGDDPSAFLNHPRWQRLIIGAAGPVANLVLAVALLTVVYATHHEIPWGLNDAAVVGACVEDSPAAKAGIHAGDRIAFIDGEENPTWKTVLNKTLSSPNLPLTVRIARGEQTLSLTLTPKGVGKQDIGEAGWLPQQPFLVTFVEPGMPGALAGLQVGDEVTAANGAPLHTLAAIQEFLQKNQAKPLQLTVLRHGQPVTLTVTPKVAEGEPRAYRIGFMSAPTQIEKLPLNEAFHSSVDDCVKMSGLVAELLGRMVERKASVKQMSGPIEIVRASGEYVQYRSLNELMNFMAMISLQLGLFNLLPIPILDGGLIAMLLIEAVMRHDINESIKMRLYQAAFVCLVLFAGMVIFNDVVKMLPGQ